MNFHILVSTQHSKRHVIEHVHSYTFCVHYTFNSIFIYTIVQRYIISIFVHFFFVFLFIFHNSNVRKRETNQFDEKRKSAKRRSCLRGYIRHWEYIPGSSERDCIILETWFTFIVQARLNWCWVTLSVNFRVLASNSMKREKGH